MYRINDNQYLEIGSGEPVERENLVQFHLLYAGPLHSGGSDNPRGEKHGIRRIFHSQLRVLWNSHPNLIEWAIMAGHAAHAEHMRQKVAGGLVPPPPGITQEEAINKGLDDLAHCWNRGGFNFLPLVQKDFCLRCSLDILFLRTDDLPFILHNGGDIDARLKILFDALRMTDVGGLPVGAQAGTDENPFFVLLQDDKLISEVRVNTDRLLKLPNERKPDQHDVYLQIGVQLNTTVKTAHSWVFE